MTKAHLSLCKTRSSNFPGTWLKAIVMEALRFTNTRDYSDECHQSLPSAALSPPMHDKETLSHWTAGASQKSKFPQQILSMLLHPFVVRVFPF